VNLFDEFMARERLAKALAAADAAKLQADASLAEIEACRRDMRRIFAEFMAALRGAAEPSKEMIQ
jgi:F0F1-type ATP synthase membrane subunit b/b'